MTDLTRAEFAAALRSIATHINGIAATFETPTTGPTTTYYILTESGDRLLASSMGDLLVLQPEPTPTP